jgi:hypothetical protein
MWRFTQQLIELICNKSKEPKKIWKQGMQKQHFGMAGVAWGVSCKLLSFYTNPKL